MCLCVSCYAGNLPVLCSSCHMQTGLLQWHSQKTNYFFIYIWIASSLTFDQFLFPSLYLTASVLLSPPIVHIFGLFPSLISVVSLSPTPSFFSFPPILFGCHLGLFWQSRKPPNFVFFLQHYLSMQKITLLLFWRFPNPVISWLFRFFCKCLESSSL